MLPFTVIATALALLVAPIYGAPAASEQPKTLKKYAGPVKADSYIVKLKAEVSKDTHLDWLTSVYNASSTVTHPDWDSRIHHGYAGTLGNDALSALLAHPDVDYIEEDAIITLASASANVTQTNAPWGLQRITQNTKLTSQNPLSLAFNYTHPQNVGSNVNIYIIDSGINVNHTDFGGRASWGATFGQWKDVDDGGHGTHVAGTAAGTTYGVAKLAKLIAVKVFDPGGDTSVSGLISAINFVGQKATTGTRTPSVANMSLGTKAGAPPIQSIDDASTALVGLGVHVVVAAGNDNINAVNTTPARATGVITVGATNIADGRAYFSNFGGVVDIFAPGENVISAAYNSNTGNAVMSGTSMATPHVAGLVAALITRDGNVSPAAMRAKVNALGLKGVITSIPSGTANLFAHI